jgi:cell division protein FtsB
MVKGRVTNKKPKKDLPREQRNTKAAMGVILFLSAVFLLFNSLLGNKSLFQLHEMQLEKERWVKKNTRQTHENEMLKGNILAARNDLFTMEKIAREDLGMVKEDEVVYLFDPRELRNSGAKVSSHP